MGVGNAELIRGEMTRVASAVDHGRNAATTTPLAEVSGSAEAAARTGLVVPAFAVLDAPSLSKPGPLTRLLEKWFFREATVTKVQVMSQHFRLITLAGEDLRGVAWVPGQKVQINVGGDAVRTFTPISWDPIAGETRILVYVHGQGPGAAWAAWTQVGMTCAVFGPRRSLTLDMGAAGLTFVFGDETSFGLALAFGASLSASEAIASLFEVSSVEEAERVWRALSTDPVTFVPRTVGGGHLDTLERRTLEIVDDWEPDRFVLTGDAASIQRVRRTLRGREIVSARIRAKAYWAAGKTGLD